MIVLEFILTFLIIGALNFGLNFLFLKKFNLITAAIFSFVVLGFFVFLTAPYLISYKYPSLIYLPPLLFWFIFTLVKINKKT